MNLQKVAGRVVANPLADPKRWHKAQHEDYYNANSSMDEIEWQDAEATAGTLLGIKIVQPDGVTVKTITFAVAVDQTDADACTTAIAEALAAEGEINQVVLYDYRVTGTLVKFQHVGIIKVTALTFTTTGDVATTRKATPNVSTQWRGFYVDSEIVTINGRAFAGASAPYAFTGTPITDDAEALLLQADLVTHIVAGDKIIGTNVRVDTIAGKYEINIYTSDNLGITVNGASLALVEAKQIFTV